MMNKTYISNTNKITYTTTITITNKMMNNLN